MDEEVEIMRKYDPRMTAKREQEYRDALGKTLIAAQLRVSDEASALFGEAFGDRLFENLRARTERARNSSLREFFRRF
jgi:hypothetical protein